MTLSLLPGALDSAANLPTTIALTDAQGSAPPHAHQHDILNDAMAKTESYALLGPGGTRILAIGLHADGVTDDSALIQSCLDQLPATGGTVYLPNGAIAVAANIVLGTSAKQNRRLVGAGAGHVHNTGSQIDGTKLLWTGASGGTMVTSSATAGAGGQFLNGCFLENLVLDGANLANVGWSIVSMRFGGTNNVTIRGCKTYGLTTEIVLLGEPAGVGWNTFANLTISALGTTNGGGMLLGGHDAGSGLYNTSFNSLVNVYVQHIGTGNGITFTSGDNNTLDGGSCYRISGTGIGLLFDGAATKNNYLFHFDPGAGQITQQNSSSNNIVWADTINYGGIPTIAAGTILRYYNHGAAGWVNSRQAKTTTYAVANADRACTIALGGTAFYAVTVGAASGFDPDFVCRITNEDTGRGKSIQINGLTTFILWPGQTITLYNSNNVWKYEDPGRWRLSGGVTVNVDGTNGLSTNDGLSTGAGGAFDTFAHARDAILNGFDLNGQNVTIQMANGTYTTSCRVTRPFVGSGVVTLQGDTTTPTNVIISTTSIDAIYVSTGGQLSVQGLQLKTTTSGYGIDADQGGQIAVTGKMDFGACADGHMVASAAGQIRIVGVSYTISGAAPIHTNASGGNFIISGGTTTISGTPAFSNAFAYGQNLGYIQSNGVTFSGSATGVRYSANTNSVIQTFGSGATYFPGGTSGTTGTGGQYA